MIFWFQNIIIFKCLSNVDHSQFHISLKLYLFFIFSHEGKREHRWWGFKLCIIFLRKIPFSHLYNSIFLQKKKTFFLWLKFKKTIYTSDKILMTLTDYDERIVHENMIKCQPLQLKDGCYQDTVVDINDLTNLLTLIAADVLIGVVWLILHRENNKRVFCVNS